MRMGALITGMMTESSPPRDMRGTKLVPDRPDVLPESHLGARYAALAGAVVVRPGSHRAVR